MGEGISESAISTPLVSIGLPVFNGDSYVSEAISSILGQTRPDFELIISDNASSDKTEEICRAFAAADPRVRYVRHEINRGAVWNFNHVFEISGGKYFKWAAHDDVMKPTFIEKCVVALESDRRYVLAYPEAIFIDADGVETARDTGFMASDSPDPVIRFRTWMAPGLGRCNPVYGLIRSDTIRKTSMHGAFPGSDNILLGEIAILGRTRAIGEGLFLRRLHPDMTSLLDSQSLAEWYEGKSVRGLRFKTIRLMREFVRAINKAELAAWPRVRCYGVLLQWAWKVRILIAKEILIPFYINGRPTALNRWLRARLGLRRSPNRHEITESPPEADNSMCKNASAR
jgi:glycosyltransferase involved in cell wall biosynthesis